MPPQLGHLSSGTSRKVIGSMRSPHFGQRFRQCSLISFSRAALLIFSIFSFSCFRMYRFSKAFSRSFQMSVIVTPLIGNSLSHFLLKYMVTCCGVNPRAVGGFAFPAFVP